MTFHRLKGLLPWHRRAREADMREELESLAAIAQPGELGNLTRAAEDARSVWTWMWFEELCRDIRYALRSMRQNPGFSATAVLSLALGIGANTAIFSLIDALMLRWLPVPNPQELVQVKMRPPHGAQPLEDTFSYAITNALAERTDIFRGVCGFSGAAFDVGSKGSVSRVPGAWVTGQCYETFGLHPVMGRLLEASDDRPAAPLVAVISYSYWQRQFASDAGVIGRPILLNGIPVSIVGISPRGFTGATVGNVTEITVAASALAQREPGAADLLQPGNFWLRILARPRKGPPRAITQLAVVWPQIGDGLIPAGWPAPARKEILDSRFALVPGGTGYPYLRERFGKPLFVLMAVSGLVLLIACANVASLLLARATARRREIAVRLAIGAGRGRIIRQLLTESTLLSSIGAAVGIGLAWLTSRFLVSTLSSGESGVVIDLVPNWHILGFASAAAIANGIVFGLAPALRTTAIGHSAPLQESGRVAGSRSRLLSALVSAQVALSLTLLIGAGLFLRTLRNLVNIDPGFKREGILLVDLDGAREGYRDARLTAFYRDLQERVRRIPGVQSASISSHTPLSGALWTEAVAPNGQLLPQRDNALFIAAGPRFFATMRTPVVAGREFDSRDEGNPNVAIVNQAFAAQYFPGRNPLGQYVLATVTKPPAELQIVGVVKNTLSTGLRDVPRPIVYVSYFQKPRNYSALEIRVAGSLSQVASAVAKGLQASFPNTPLEVRPLDNQVRGTLLQERLMAKLAGGFGGLGLLLACVGLYGLLAYSVAAGTKEIGVRMALGARQLSVLWTVMRRAIGLVVSGIALGLPLAWLLSRRVQTMLFGLRATDFSTIGTAILLLAAAGLVAAFLPARRAATVDPMTALRHD